MRREVGVQRVLQSLIALLVVVLAACTAAHRDPDRTAAHPRIPRTAIVFNNAPDQFQFVVIGDRTGGHRPGVFSRAIDQINLLQPEFVLGVGDLIEGYTEDAAVLDAQWREVDVMLERLQMPFFRVVGNHDIGNPAMHRDWVSRYGATYYHMRYRDVLFLFLNTEDPPVRLPPDIQRRQHTLETMMQRDPAGTQQAILAASAKLPESDRLPGQVAISEQQTLWVEKVLAAHRDVRWTVVLMHKPAWLYRSASFAKIETLLEGRPYTVFAGHEHYYGYTNRAGRDYIDMGTTGGVWLRDGPGRFDHVAWVTMTGEGPVIANIKLDGLTDKRALD